MVVIAGNVAAMQNSDPLVVEPEESLPTLAEATATVRLNRQQRRAQHADAKGNVGRVNAEGIRMDQAMVRRKSRELQRKHGNPREAARQLAIWLEYENALRGHV